VFTLQQPVMMGRCCRVVKQRRLASLELVELRALHPTNVVEQQQ